VIDSTETNGTKDKSDSSIKDILRIYFKENRRIRREKVIGGKK
jgi:hypothetical protein